MNRYSPSHGDFSQSRKITRLNTFYVGVRECAVVDPTSTGRLYTLSQLAEVNSMDTIQTVPDADVTSQPTIKLGPCCQCGIDREYYDEQIRLLQERIETLEIKNTTLSLECNRLRTKLQESEFRGRSRLVYFKSLPSHPIEMYNIVYLYQLLLPSQMRYCETFSNLPHI